MVGFFHGGNLPAGHNNNDDDDDDDDDDNDDDGKIVCVSAEKGEQLASFSNPLLTSMACMNPLPFQIIIITRPRLAFGWLGLSNSQIGPTDLAKTSKIGQN